MEKDILLKGYKKQDAIISIFKANVVAILFLFIVFTINLNLFYSIWGNKQENVVSLKALILSIVLIFVHEAFHCIGYLKSKDVNLNDIKIGFVLKYMMPYAHCKKLLDINTYRFAVLLPMITTGILPVIIGLFMGKLYIVVSGSFMIVSAAGDLLI